MQGYYMQKPNGPVINILDHFEGLNVLSIIGMGDTGGANNIYIDRWIGSNTADVYIPTNPDGTPNISYEAKDVVMTFYISNNIFPIDVMVVREKFISFIQGITYFVDDFRRLKNTLIFTGETGIIGQNLVEGNVNNIQFSCKFEKVNSIDIQL